MRALLMCALAGLGSAGAKAAQPPVDAELLEFLGSVDSDDESWQEYLEHKPVKPPPPDKPVAKQAKPVAKTEPPKHDEKKVTDK
jgi:hypothetical protein